MKARQIAKVISEKVTALATDHPPIQNDLLSVALPDASWLLITLDDSLLAGEIAARVREQGDLLRIAACGHQAEEVHHLLIRGAHQVVQSEEEAARRLCQLATHAP